MRSSGAFLVVAALVVACGQAEPGGAPVPLPVPTPSISSAPTARPSPATPSPSPSVTPSAVPSGPAQPHSLRRGDHGPQVLAVQQRLVALGYWLGVPDGSYGDLTEQAVVALQKAAGLARDGRVGSRTRAALRRGDLPRASSTTGHVVEIDLARQLLLVVDAGNVQLVLNTSTGSGATYWYRGSARLAVTPRGRHVVYAQIDGLRRSPLGLLWRPKYFHGGIAVHGSPSVPPWPASHGCVRLSYPAMDMLWSDDLMPVGTAVLVR